MTSPTNASIDLSRLRRVHLVGIGGMHMSAIASILLARGVQVTGSDISPSRYTERLQAEGATVFAGHAAVNLGQPDLVVTTVAAGSANPELAAARARGLPVLVRAEMVAALMQGHTAVCVAGTHGKTTTSSLIAFGLVQAGRDPTYLLGGDSYDLGTNAAPGQGAEIVVEADEYAEAFLHYRPDLAVITNIEIDHLDYYGTEERLVGAFASFMNRVRPGEDGMIIAGIDSPRLRALVAGYRGMMAGPIETYAMDREADWTAVELGGAPQQFAVTYRGRSHGEFETPLVGRHMVSNCLAAIAALTALEVPADRIRAAIASFRGARRRFELVGEVNGVTVIDDYAHHPTEVAANLAAARSRFPGRRVVAVFQPHTYSRTTYLFDAFVSCFEQADVLLLLQTYAARETADAGLDGLRLAEAVTRPKPAFVTGTAEAVAWLRANTRKGDVVITLGAGPVDAVARDFLGERRP